MAFWRSPVVISIALLSIPAPAPAAPQSYENARRLYEKRDLAAARREFLRIVASAPPALHSRYYLGRIALLESKPLEAIRWLEPVARADPPILDALAQLGKAYFETGQLDKAEQCTARAIRQTPWDGALHYRLARIFQQTGRPDLARKEFAESARLRSADRQSVELLLECSRHIARREIGDAMSVRQQLLANRALDPDVLVALGVTFAAAGLHAEALDPFEEAARRDPASFQARYNAGLAMLNTGRAADAIGYLRAGLALAPDSPDALSALSIAYVLSARYQEAKPALEHWIQLQPDNARARSMLALVDLRTGSPAESVRLLRKVIPELKDDPKPRFLLIEALNATERQEEALQAADEAARLFPDLAQAHLAKAQQLARIGRYQEAGPEFERALELAPGRVDALLGLAEVQQKQGRYADSLATYRQALAADPASLTAILGAARDLLSLQKLAEAREILERALERHAASSQLHYELSRVYARSGERDKAAEQMRITQELRSRETPAR
ncbi:MAG TPA: tetratricopeptide repeat protein [Bryobacteraceae bacterium]|nr:tetratricopeptide repeat protein [Bryobacteraceae bacterium]